MIDFKQLINEERNLGKNPAALYKTAAFENIDKNLSAIGDEEELIDLRDAAKAELENNEDSLVLSYIAGRIGTMLRPHEYSMRLNNLLLSFYETGNWDMVKYIGALILSSGESSKALRVLGDVADLQGEEEKKWDYYERLVRSDSSDKEIIIIVADHFDEIGDKQKAMNYYQRAVLRLQKAEDAQKIKEIFQKLLSNGRSGYPFYSSFIEKESEKNPQLALELYRLLLEYMLKERESYAETSSEYKRNIENTIEITRRILTISPEDQETRKTLSDSLKLKYKDSQRLQECMKHHNVMATGKDPVKVLDEFILTLCKLACLFLGKSRSTFFHYLECRGCVFDIIAGSVSNDIAQGLVFFLGLLKHSKDDLLEFLQFFVAVTNLRFNDIFFFCHDNMNLTLILFQKPSMTTQQAPAANTCYCSRVTAILTVPSFHSTSGASPAPASGTTETFLASVCEAT